MVGIAAIYSNDVQALRVAGHSLTENLITLSVFGAILLYLISLLALFKVRRSEPNMVRTFRAPFYTYPPIIALFGVIVSLVSMIYYKAVLDGMFAVILLIGFAYFQLTHRHRTAPADATVALDKDAPCGPPRPPQVFISRKAPAPSWRSTQGSATDRCTTLRSPLWRSAKAVTT